MLQASASQGPAAGSANALATASRQALASTAQSCRSSPAKAWRGWKRRRPISVTTGQLVSSTPANAAPTASGQTRASAAPAVVSHRAATHQVQPS